jgi:hypothetical protein
MAGEAGRRLKAPEKDAARGDGRVEEEQLETPEAEAAAAGGNGREQGRAGKIRGPVRISKIGPILLKYKFKKFKNC